MNIKEWYGLSLAGKKYWFSMVWWRRGKMISITVAALSAISLYLIPSRQHIGLGCVISIVAIIACLIGLFKD